MMRRTLASLLVLLPLAACADVQPPLSPGETTHEPAGPRFALERMSRPLVPGHAAHSAAAPIVSVPEAIPSALVNNGPSHIVWQNANTGLRVFWQMSGTAWGGDQNDLSTIDPSWTIVASADFTGDGNPDLLWQRRASGEQVIWHMNGFGWTEQQTALPQVQPGWWIVGAGDFTGDGKPDILWQNRAQGRQVIWHMNGTAWSGGQNELTQVSPEWWIAAVGDFTGDSRPDIVFQNESTWRQVIWHMNGATWSGLQNELQPVSAGWRVVGASDFTGDGRVDLLWQNRDVGRQVIWHMNGTTWGGAQNELAQVSPEWRIATAMTAPRPAMSQAPAEAIHKVSYTSFRKPPYGMKAATPWLQLVHTGPAGTQSWAEIDAIELWAEIDGVARRMDQNLYDNTVASGQLRTRTPWFDSTSENMPYTLSNGVMVIRPSDRPEKVWHPYLETYPNDRKDLSSATRVWFVSRVRLHGPVAVQGGIDYYRELGGYTPGSNRREEGAATDWVYMQDQWITLTMERSTEVVSPIELSPPSADGTYPAGQPITARFVLRNADDDRIRLGGVGIDTRLVSTTDPYCDPSSRQWVAAFGWAVDADLAPGGVVSHTAQWANPAPGDYCIRVVEQRQGVYQNDGTPLYQQPYASFPYQVIRVR